MRVHSCRRALLARETRRGCRRVDGSYQVVDLCCTDCVDELDGGLDEEHDDHEVRHLGGVKTLVARREKREERRKKMLLLSAAAKLHERAFFFVFFAPCYCEAKKTDKVTPAAVALPAGHMRSDDVCHNPDRLHVGCPVVFRPAPRPPQFAPPYNYMRLPCTKR